MKIENKEMLLYSMDKAYEELYKKASDRNAEEREIYYHLGTALHWIVDCYDRVKGTGIEEQDEKIFKAVKGANNAQKHIRQRYKLHEADASGHPKKYPKHYGVKYLWANIEKIPLNHKSEKIAYQELFYGKNILNELSKAKLLIHEYFERCD